MSELKKMEEVFKSIDEKELMNIAGGARKVPGWAKLVDAIGGAFNDVSRNLGY